MKSALKKSVVSTSISLILASGMAAFAAHAADDVKLKATKTNVAFSDFTPTEYSTKGKPNIIVLTMDYLGYGQLPFDKGSFDPKTMENREVVDTYKIGIDKAIEAAQKSTPTLLSLMDEGVRFTNGYVAHGVSGPSRAEESPENETDIALCDLLICANNSMRSLLCLFIKYVRISSGMP